MSSFTRITPTSVLPTPDIRAPSTQPSDLLSRATIHLAACYRRTNPAFRLPVAVPPRCLTKPSEPKGNNGFDNVAADLILHVGDKLNDKYTVLDMLGTGTFGQVVRCETMNEEKGEKCHVAVKVIKRHAAFKNQAWIEVSILRILHNAAQESEHIVHFHRHFIYRDHLCLVFELLSINLYQFLKASNYRGVHLSQLRTVLEQLLSALQILVRCGIIHCDLKPENILLYDPSVDSKVKLIDFGSACQLDYPVYQYVQSRFYRSPEVLLGMNHYDSQIDMWSLGCVAAEMFLGIPLFPGQNEMNMVQRIIEMLGPMPDLFLRRCNKATKFYNSSGNAFGLKTNEQYEVENECKLAPSKKYFSHTTLQDIVMQAPWKSEPPHKEEIQHRRAFLDMLRWMLKVDPLERLSPDEATQHPFITGELTKIPWMPPKRPIRILGRVRQTMVGAIDISPNSEESLANGAGTGMYANSAPSLRAHPNFLQGAEQMRARMLEAVNNNGAPPVMMGAGSYIPPSALNQYMLRAAQQPPSHLANSVGRHDTSYVGPSVGSYGATPIQVGSYGAPPPQVGSYGVPTQVGSYGTTPQLPVGSYGMSPYGSSYAAQGPQPGSYMAQQNNLGYHPAFARHQQQHREPMHVAYERRSRLQTSPSRESLMQEKMQRAPSAEDLADKGMFPFGMDDSDAAPQPPPPQDAEMASPGNSGRGGNLYSRGSRPPAPSGNAVQSPRKTSAALAAAAIDRGNSNDR